MGSNKGVEKQCGVDTRSRIVEYLRLYVSANGYAPSMREIADACKIGSTSSVDYHLNKLHKDGVIRRDRRKNRAIVLLKG